MAWFPMVLSDQKHGLLWMASQSFQISLSTGFEFGRP
jgi:hypothetical protein